MTKQARTASKSATRPTAKTSSANKAVTKQKSAQKPAGVKRAAPVVQAGLISNLCAAADSSRVVPKNKTKRTASHTKRTITNKVSAAKGASAKARTQKPVAKTVAKSATKGASKPVKRAASKSQAKRA